MNAELELMMWNDNTGQPRCSERCPSQHEHCYTCRLPAGHNGPHLHECEVDELRSIVAAIAARDFRDGVLYDGIQCFFCKAPVNYQVLDSGGPEPVRHEPTCEYARALALR